MRSERKKNVFAVFSHVQQQDQKCIYITRPSQANDKGVGYREGLIFAVGRDAGRCLLRSAAPRGEPFLST